MAGGQSRRVAATATVAGAVAAARRFSRAATRLLLAGTTAALLLAAGGCATPLRTQVTAFNQVGDEAGAFAGRRFVIVPTAAQRGSLEFASYADLVRRELVARGLVDAGDARGEFDVGLQYAITRVAEVQAPAGPTGGFSIGSGGRGGIAFGIGLGFPLGGAAEPPPDMRHRRELRVTIERSAASRIGPSAAGGVRLYEGSVVSEGPSASLAPVMPAMVRALFQTFPGANGISHIVDVPLDAVEPSTVGR